jgi:hypothetical protein
MPARRRVDGRVKPGHDEKEGRFHLIGYCSSVPNQKFAASNCGWGIVAAEALDRGENIVGGLGPAEGLWIGVVAGDELVNGSVQGVEAAVDTASDLPFGKQGEEPLDPGFRRGRLWLSQDELVGVR